MATPQVSFIVPCYKLAHLLPECIYSILNQTYRDVEVIIMDDCSPDATPAVANSFDDNRVVHVRNETNLGHLANYNRGIELARGKYVWLISADDRLRKPSALQQYVTLMEKHPEAGYVFCPAIGLEDGQETELLLYSFHGPRNRIFSGRKFIRKLLEMNSVVAASGMVRKECYEKISVFPLDMPYAGDWYLWCLFALHYDVAYVAEPMVNYRQHTRSMTNILRIENRDILFKDDVEVLARVRDMACRAGKTEVAKKCDGYIAERCVGRLLDDERCLAESDGGEIEKILGPLPLNQHEKRVISARYFSEQADRCYHFGKTDEAGNWYRYSLRTDRLQMDTFYKYLLLRFGNMGRLIRAIVSFAKKCVKRARSFSEKKSLWRVSPEPAGDSYGYKHNYLHL